ncbi:MAG: hypothetical protein R3F46_04275 [bacterium]
MPRHGLRLESARPSLLMALLGLLALLPSAAEDNHSILLRHDWGSPPPLDMPLRNPELLPYRGWCRFAGAAEESLILPDGNVMLFCDAERDFLGIDSGGGAETGRSDSGFDFLFSAWPLAGDRVIIGNGWGPGRLGVVSLAGLSWDWQAEDLSYLGRAGNLLWCVRPAVGNPLLQEWFSSEVLLLDGSIGGDRAAFGLSEVRGIGLGDCGPDGSIVAKLEDGYYALSPDGSRTRLAQSAPDRLAEIGMFPGGFLSFEYEANPSELEEMAMARRGESGVADISEEQWEAWQPRPASLACYGLPDGGLRWSRAVPLEDNAFSAYGHDLLRIHEGFAGLRLDRSQLLVSIADGSDIGSTELLSDLAALPHAIHRDRVYILEAGEEPGTGHLRIVRIPELTEQRLELGGLGSVAGVWATEGRLVLSTGNRGWSSSLRNSCTYCIELDANGLPLEGEMQAVAFPDSFAQLGRRFLASADPLADDALMTEIVNGGMNAVYRLLERCPLDMALQLDALLDAADYIAACQPEQQAEVVHTAFLELLGERASPELVPALLRWIDDSQRQDMSMELRGILAQCGTSSAAEFLSAADPPVLSRHRFPQGPYTLSPVSSWPSGFGPGSTPVAISLLQTGADGNYGAWYCDGLISGTVIYVGHDADGDGAYETVWPTSLRQCYDELQAHSYDKPLPMGGLELLGLEGGMLELSYLQAGWDPALGPEEHGWGADFVLPATAGVSLPALAADADDDGLSDIAEQLLATDPRNPDTDGDGLGDREDGAPLCNPRWMGQAERGVARALEYFFNGEQRDSWPGWWTDGTGNPWQARYAWISGAAPVDYVADPGTWCIMRDSVEYRSRLRAVDTDPGAYTRSGSERVSLHWFQRAGTLRERHALYCIQRGIDPLSATEREILDWSGSWYRPDSHPAELRRLVDSSEAENPARDFGISDCDASLSLDFHGVGYVVKLKLLEGEYYPISSDMTWIS